MKLGKEFYKAWNSIRKSTEDMNAGSSSEESIRQTQGLPNGLLSLMSSPASQMAIRVNAENLRKFSKSPIPRRAINLIKDRVVSMGWHVRLKAGYTPSEVKDAAAKLRALRRSMEEPNAGDSFRTLVEQVLEDLLVLGCGAIEIGVGEGDSQPVRLWPIDASSIRLNLAWDGKSSSPRYFQSRRNFTESHPVELNDAQIIYIRSNPRTYTVFGLSPLEVAFESINSLLHAQRFASKLASNGVAQYALWLNSSTPTQQERVIRWWEDEVEGTGRVPILSSEQKPEVIRFAQGTDSDLRLAWQEFLIRMVANAFGLPPLMFGLEKDVNRSTATEQGDEGFRTAIAPLAKLVAEHITRDVFAKALGWSEFEFVFSDLESRDELTEVQIQTELLKVGVLTINEVRAIRGLGPMTHEDKDQLAFEQIGQPGSR